MDRHDAHGTAGLGRCNLGIGLLPAAQEGAQIVAARGHPVLQVIHERLDVGNFGLETIRIGLPKVPEQGLGQVCERMEVLRNAYRQRGGQEARHGRLFGIIGQVAQRHLRHQAAHRYGGFHIQGIVRDNRYPLLHQSGGDICSAAVVPHQDGHIAPVGALPFQVPERGNDFCHLVLQETDFQPAGIRVLETGILFYVGI